MRSRPRYRSNGRREADERRRTFKLLRQLAPKQDRGNPALSPMDGTPAAHSLTKDRPPPRVTAAQQGSDALAVLAEDCGEHGGDAVLIAVWSSVSSWWGRRTNTFGHRQASVLHSDASNRIKGKGEILPTYPDDKQADYQREAALALTAWEAAGSPGLLSKIATTREWVAKISNQQTGGPSGPNH